MKLRSSNVRKTTCTSMCHEHDLSVGTTEPGKNLRYAEPLRYMKISMRIFVWLDLNNILLIHNPVQS